MTKKFEKKELTEDEKKIEHINKCEFCSGRRAGQCPTISKEEFARLKAKCGSKGMKGNSRW